MPPFRLLDLAADELPHLPVQLDQRRIHRPHRTLPRGMYPIFSQHTLNPSRNNGVTPVREMPFIQQQEL